MATSWAFKTIITSIAAFLATNIDDILILMLFFAQTNAKFRVRQIVAGQYLGFTALVVASLPGFFGGLLVRRPWIGLLGLVPIAIGIKFLMHGEDLVSEVQIVRDLPPPKTDQPAPSRSPKISMYSALTGLLSPQIYSVAAVTFANGGDNIGVYVPLFAGSDLGRLGIILSIFFFLVGIWCFVGYQLTRYPAIVQILTRHSSTLAPLILIGLGIFILLENGTLALLLKI
jgi:cadmium resistance protein CadD (predicted permease)